MKRPTHPFIQALEQRRKLLYRLLLGLDPAYKMALTHIDSPILADKIISTTRLQGRLLQKFSQVFELPTRPDLPPSMVELLNDPPEIWPELMKSAGLMLNFKRLPPVLLKHEMETLAELFGRKIVGTVFKHRNFAPNWETADRIAISEINTLEFYEDGAYSLRIWANDRLGEMIGWFLPLLPPAIGENFETEAFAFEDAIQNASNTKSDGQINKLLSKELPEQVAQRLAIIDLLLPLIRTIVQEQFKEQNIDSSSPYLLTDEAAA